MSAATKHTPDEDAPADDDSQARAVLAVYENPAVAFEKPDSLDAFYTALERKVDAFQPDLSTQTSRKKITSLVYEIARAKTALDDAGKSLNAAKRTEINKVDEVRRSLRDRFDTLGERARQPLTDWEQAEERRQEQVVRDLAELREAGMVFNDDTVADLEERLAKIKAMVIDPEVFRDDAKEAEARRAVAATSLAAGIERLLDQERQAAEHEKAQAELAVLRAEKEERDRRDAARAEAERIEREEAARIAREKADQEARARAEEERAERERERREREAAEAEERMKAAAVAAEKRAREEAAAEAERERREIEERHAAELRRIQEEADRKERERLAEEKRQREAAEAEEARRQEEARVAREAEEKRQADKRHRAKIKGEVIAAIVQVLSSSEYGLTKEGAELTTRDSDLIDEVVELIANGRIVHTSIQF